jgi:hypothetical protein
MIPQFIKTSHDRWENRFHTSLLQRYRQCADDNASCKLTVERRIPVVVPTASQIVLHLSDRLCDGISVLALIRQQISSPYKFAD